MFGVLPRRKKDNGDRLNIISLERGKSISQDFGIYRGNNRAIRGNPLKRFPDFAVELWRFFYRQGEKIGTFLCPDFK